MRLAAKHRDIAADAVAEAIGLAVANIVAMAAPAIEQPRPFTRRAIEQAAGGTEGLGSVLDGLMSASDDLFAGHAARSAIMSPAVAFALPTTPGIPAPGWVPAPTK